MVEAVLLVGSLLLFGLLFMVAGWGHNSAATDNALESVLGLQQNSRTVAYIYNTDTSAASQFQNLLQKNDWNVTLFPVSQLRGVDLSHSGLASYNGNCYNPTTSTARKIWHCCT